MVSNSLEAINMHEDLFTFTPKFHSENSKHKIYFVKFLEKLSYATFRKTIVFTRKYPQGGMIWTRSISGSIAKACQ